MQTFENIGITGFCEEKSHNPDKQFLLFNMYLQLNAAPPNEWKDFFNESRRLPRAQLWRKAWIEGDTLVAYCQPEELQQQIEELKEDLAVANQQYRQLLALRAQRRRLQDQVEQEEACERRLIRQLAQQLRF
ncbi:hypothetical protein [Chromobacterium violaceum]|uniref:Uncharacterized protein n=2 Tax=Chromobacterium violaceum TaxID=536 RepID=A0A1R0M7L4_CHRVL|nr:hypothetical protein [Chromobacterium violaceum]AAQ59957.1 hypothetical protein CV_2285 [Chromobacterium violaceum ATCC 12472]ATP28769.1 hypothetical protein CRN81_10370 [Chromobacterium violaceum]ATP32680.1 hypothetical protein CR207_10400 [Chromobacterium violaceum]KJH66375.1 hypothetical protein UF16_16745 [Chromobacterium violaceum]KMN48645.1 hypothetical protein VK93_14085 [Chromobacterium violaceum]